MIPRLIALLVLIGMTGLPAVAWAQGAFPAPLPSQGASDGASAPPLPGISAPTQVPATECIKGFWPLREDAEKKGKLIKAAGERHAVPEDACKLIGSYIAAEVKMIKYVESNVAKCGIPAQVADELKVGHKNTEGFQKKVCDIAEQVRMRGKIGPSMSEVLGTSQVPEPKRGPVGDFEMFR